MIRRCVSTLLLLCALFSGHLLARQQGHDYFPVPSLEQRLLHEADCDELRSQYDDAATNLRQQHRWQNARRAKTYSRG